MSAPCVDQPVSWLRLERYRLGELAAPDVAAIDAHLARCAACAAALRAVEADTRRMPALPAAPPARPVAVRWAFLWAPAAALAALLLVVLRPEVAPPGSPVASLPAPSVRVKGGQHALALVRQRDGATTEDPTAWRSGDRFQVRATCPGPGDGRWELVVYQDGQVFFPAARPVAAPCGNRVPLPAGFTINAGGPVLVCLLAADAAPARAALRETPPTALPAGAVCAGLRAPGSP